MRLIKGQLCQLAWTNHLTDNDPSDDKILAAVLQLNLTTDGNPNTGSVLVASHSCVTGSINMLNHWGGQLVTLTSRIA